MPETAVRLEQMMPLILEQLKGGGRVQFTPQGTSMLPMLRGGRDQVLLAPAPPRLKKYDLPLYRRDNGQYVLHRVVRAGETYTCIGDNQYVYEHGLRQEQMVALVAGFTRRGRRWDTDDLRYRLYCRLWHWSRPVRYGLQLLRRAAGKALRRLGLRKGMSR